MECMSLAVIEPDTMKWIAIGSIGIVAIVGGYIAGIAKTSLREHSRREIAAYIAEGSMSPEQGEKLMKAGKPSDWDE